MDTFLPLWVELMDAFGVLGAAMVLIYAGLLVALVVLVVMESVRLVRQLRQRNRVRRQLRVIREAAYRERPAPRDPYAA